MELPVDKSLGGNVDFSFSAVPVSLISSRKLTKRDTWSNYQKIQRSADDSDSDGAICQR